MSANLNALLVALSEKQEATQTVISNLQTNLAAMVKLTAQATQAALNAAIPPKAAPTLTAEEKQSVQTLMTMAGMSQQAAVQTVLNKRDPKKNPANPNPVNKIPQAAPKNPTLHAVKPSANKKAPKVPAGPKNPMPPRGEGLGVAGSYDPNGSNRGKIPAAYFPAGEASFFEGGELVIRGVALEVRQVPEQTYHKLSVKSLIEFLMENPDHLGAVNEAWFKKLAEVANDPEFMAYTNSAGLTVANIENFKRQLETKRADLAAALQAQIDASEAQEDPTPEEDFADESDGEAIDYLDGEEEPALSSDDEGVY